MTNFAVSTVLAHGLALLESRTRASTVKSTYLTGKQTTEFMSPLPKHRNLPPMSLLPDTQNRGLCMRRECRERLPRHRIQMKQLASDHGTGVTHVPWCMSGSLNRAGGGNVPGIPDACATRNFMYLARAPWQIVVAQSNRTVELLRPDLTFIV